MQNHQWEEFCNSFLNEAMKPVNHMSHSVNKDIFNPSSQESFNTPAPLSMPAEQSMVGMIIGREEGPKNLQQMGSR